MISPIHKASPWSLTTNRLCLYAAGLQPSRRGRPVPRRGWFISWSSLFVDTFVPVFLSNFCFLWVPLVVSCHVCLCWSRCYITTATAVVAPFTAILNEVIFPLMTTLGNRSPEASHISSLAETWICVRDAVIYLLDASKSVKKHHFPRRRD